MLWVRLDFMPIKNMRTKAKGKPLGKEICKQKRQSQSKGKQVIVEAAEQGDVSQNNMAGVAGLNMPPPYPWKPCIRTVMAWGG